MSRTFQFRIHVLLCLFLLLLLAPLAKAQNGIFADFTTSMGNFTCQLDYTNAPKAVANFIGLATGQRAWLDLTTGQARTNGFYGGVTFHRVISGFMIQGGSPNGQGTDGPGYAFPDEITPALRFNGPGVLAMANSGPKSNGSQFFITVEPAAWLNDGYTIFGWLVSGTNVVTAINHVATDANDKPLTNVVIQSVVIRRMGTAAQAFNIDAQNLPVVSNIGLKVTNTPTAFGLTFTNRQYADNELYSTTNLSVWSSEFLGVEITPPTTNSVYRTKDVPRRFYRFAQVQYPSSTFAPKNLFGRTLTLTFSGGGVLTIAFNSSGHGTYTYPPNPSGTITGYTWYQDIYRGYLWPVYFSGYYYMYLQMNFTSNTAGNFSGTIYTTPPGSVSGTFTMP